MWSIYFLILAVLNTMLLVWAWRLWGRVPRGLLAMVVAPVLFLPYDNLIIALGRWIGEGDLLQALNWPRFAAHALITPLWVIAAGSMARLAGLRWAQPKAVMAAWCVVATALIVVLDLPKLIALELHPACFADTLRYAESVSASQLCASTQAVIPSSGPPIAAIVAVVALVGVGAAVWRAARWPWLFAGAGVMFITAAAPTSLVGPGIGSLGEVVLAAALLATAQHLSRTKLGQPVAAPAA